MPKRTFLYQIMNGKKAGCKTANEYAKTFELAENMHDLAVLHGKLRENTKLEKEVIIYSELRSKILF